MPLPLKSCLEAVLLLLYCPGNSGRYGEAVRGITRLDKLLYLIIKETSFGDAIEDEFKFEAYDYGPYSSEIYDAVETLKDVGLLTVKTEEFGDYWEISDAETIEREVTSDEGRTPLSERKLEIYSLSDSGMKAGKKLFDCLTPEEKKGLKKIKEKFNPMPLRELVKYVYKKYPESTIRSKIRESILGKSKFGTKPSMKPFQREEEDFRT